MTIAAGGEFHFTYNNNASRFQQLYFPDNTPSAVNVVAITIVVTGQTTGTYAKIWVENIHKGTVTGAIDDLPFGYAEMVNSQAQTFTVEPGGVGAIWVEEGAGNTSNFEVRWFPSFIGRTYGHRSDPYFQMSGNRPNWRGSIL